MSGLEVDLVGHWHFMMDKQMIDITFGQLHFAFIIIHASTFSEFIDEDWGNFL